MKVPSRAIDQGRNLVFVGNRRPVDEDDVTPHSEVGMARAMFTASSVAAACAIRVALVSTSAA